MATGRTQLDTMVGPQPEDLVAKIRQASNGNQDAGSDKAQEGGSNKLPQPYTPFTLGK